MNGDGVPASLVDWHDTGVDSVTVASDTMVWTVELSERAARRAGCSQGGQLTFVGVSNLEGVHDLKYATISGPTDWELLRADFGLVGGSLRIRFFIQIDHYRERTVGYAELTVTCEAAMFHPDTPQATQHGCAS